jgi:nucleotide-binding universal stress UspA family protein
MKRILVPIDGSDGSLKALEYVAGRRKYGERAEVLILNVQPEIPPSKFVSKDMVERHHQAESQKALGKAKVKALRDELEADEYVEIGDPAETIVKFAKKTVCQEIVMATRGLGRLKGMLLGSVATKVVQLAHVPVVLVK